MDINKLPNQWKIWLTNKYSSLDLEAMRIDIDLLSLLNFTEPVQ